MSMNPAPSRPKIDHGRRRFLKLPLAAGAAGLLLHSAYSRNADSSGSPKPPKTVIDEQDEKNVKITHRVSPNLTDDELTFLKQIGLRWARVEFPTGEATMDNLTKMQERFAKYDIKVASVVNYVHRSVKIQLGQKGRDEDIESYQDFLKNMGKLKIPVASIDWHPANTYTTSEVERRGYKTREFNLDDFRKKIEKQRFDREYSADDMWESYSYFIKAVLPAAEKADVKIALHPDDPPIDKMNGVARIFAHYDGFHKAEQIAGKSKHWGLTFCVGTWSEGGDKLGKDVFEMIKDFGGRGKIAEVHFRNVNGPLPHFVETFLDDGYMDMYKVMKALREVGFNGPAEPDHVPKLAGDKGILPAGTTYCIAYMRALLRRANEEVG